MHCAKLAEREHSLRLLAGNVVPSYVGWLRLWAPITAN